MVVRDLYIFLGAPGSGKGSLAARCVQEMDWYQLSTGNLCRYHMSAKTPQGLEMDLAIKSGRLVSDDLITGMVFDWLSHDNGVQPLILDGFPRTLMQAQALDVYLESETEKRYRCVVINFDIQDNVVIDRVGARCVCSNKSCQAVYSCLATSPCKPRRDMVCDTCGSSLVRRVDDTRETIQERLAVYKQHAEKILDFYRSKKMKIVTLDASEVAFTVYQLFKKMIGITA
jgi:adenylate kinase